MKTAESLILFLLWTSTFSLINRFALDFVFAILFKQQKKFSILIRILLLTKLSKKKTEIKINSETRFSDFFITFLLKLNHVSYASAETWLISFQYLFFSFSCNNCLLFHCLQCSRNIYLHDWLSFFSFHRFDTLELRRMTIVALTHLHVLSFSNESFDNSAK